ncbi:hypothetical protein [Treponema sp.]|uniref:hypothetical protein n=1 Tax=Treponema sp. TaxID=166 RepID=UPI00298E266B|nr:hypothetical protein [Treponema sp.]MCR5613211.1 hypothetical protein [Treponema sp.]
MLAAINPVKQEIAVYETDGSLIHTISVWDWKTLSKKYSLDFEDSILSLTYSKKGTYVIAGTVTENGTIFINASSGKIEKPVSEKMNMMAYIETSQTEKNIMSYSLTGNITYYNMSSGKLVKKIASELGLEKIVSFSKNRYFAGIKNNSIIILDAMTGKNVYTINAVKPLLFNYQDNLYYIDVLSSKSIAVFSFTETNGELKNPVIYKNLTGKFNEKVSSFLITNQKILIGTNKGNIYSAENVTGITEEIALVTKGTTQRILDAAFINEDLFILTDKCLYKTAEDKTSVIELIKNTNYTNLTAHENSIILWSQGNNVQVSQFNPETNATKKLFVSKGQILTVKSCAGNLIDIESSSTVNRFNFANNSLVELYYGSGIQDAVMSGTEELYIAKSVVNEIDSPLIYVNTRTHETVPLKTEATYIYGLSDNKTEDEKDDKKNLYLLGVQQKNKNNTSVILSFNIETKKTEIIKQFAKTDMNSFLSVINATAYTNTKDSGLSSVTVKGKKSVEYKRSCALPKRITANAQHLVSINKDGSLSWYKPTSSDLENDWYITQDGNLVIY